MYWWSNKSFNICPHCTRRRILTIYAPFLLNITSLQLPCQPYLNIRCRFNSTTKKMIMFWHNKKFLLSDNAITYIIVSYLLNYIVQSSFIQWSSHCMIQEKKTKVLWTLSKFFGKRKRKLFLLGLHKALLNYPFGRLSLTVGWYIVIL